MKRSLAVALPLAAAAVALAPTASAEIPTAVSSYTAHTYTPTYVHDAYAGGYASQDACVNTLAGVNNTGTWTVDGGPHGNPMTFGTSSYGEVHEDDNCWRTSSGRWTYGSIGFRPQASNIKTFATQMRTTGYTRYKPVSNAHIHTSARYGSEDACLRTRDGVAATIARSGGRVINMGACVELIHGASDTYTYGQISYVGPRSAYGGDHRVANPYFVMVPNWLT